MTCEQDSAGWPSLQTIPADAIPLAASPRPSRAGGGLSLASLIVIPAKASDPASPFPPRSWPGLIRPSSFTRQMRGSGPAHDDPENVMMDPTSGYFFPSPLWGGMSERSEDRVGSA